MATSELISSIQQLWGLTQGDDEAACVAAEHRLGITLPLVLRSVYRHTDLRSGPMGHLRTLERLEIDTGHLVFADEQQHTASWALRVEDLDDPDPPVCWGALGTYRDDEVRCSDIVMLVSLMNRAFTDPLGETLMDTVNVAEVPGWRCWRLELRAWGLVAIWTNGEAVFQEDYGQVGARDRAALRDALVAFGDSLEDSGFAPLQAPANTVLAQAATARMQGDAAAAEELAMRFLTGQDADPRGWVALALVERMRGAVVDADDAWKAASTRGPDEPLVRALRALLDGSTIPGGTDAILWPEFAAQA